MKLSAPAAALAAAVSSLSSPRSSCATAAALREAAATLVEALIRGQPLDAHLVRGAMESALEASDAEGAWDWKLAYDACEAAQVLFLRKFGPSMLTRAGAPDAFLAMLAKLAALTPSQTRRSEESQALQQFSTPITLGFAAATAAAITPADLVLEPSAGTGLLAIFAELAKAPLVLNEIADTRASLLELLFAGPAVTRYDAAQIHDYLDPGVKPTVVLMNPPFSALAHVEGRVADTAFRHISSALARLAVGGRLVAITGASLSSDNLAWRDSFIRLQERGRIVFSTAIDGRVYARHGTTIDTRLTVIDRVPADDPTVFPASPGMASDPAILLDWVQGDVPVRPTVAIPPRGASLPALPLRPRRPTFSMRPVVPVTPVDAIELSYEPCDWRPAEEGRITEALYEAYALQIDSYTRCATAPDPPRAVGSDGVRRAAEAELSPAPSFDGSRERPAQRRSARERHLCWRGAFGFFGGVLDRR